MKVHIFFNFIQQFNLHAGPISVVRCEPRQPGIMTAFQVQMGTHFTVCVCFAETHRVSVGKYPSLNTVLRHCLARAVNIPSVFSCQDVLLAQWILLTSNQEARVPQGTKKSHNSTTPISQKLLQKQSEALMLLSLAGAQL